MNKIRLILWAVVVVAAGWTVYLALNKNIPQSSGKFGGEFELQATNGKTYTQDDLLGKPHLVFFGFTHCPEVCPTTLYEVSGWIDDIGKAADDLNVYFFTVDPERDTPEILKNYLSPFSKHVIGLTGSPDQIEKAAKGYHIYYKKIPTDDGSYTMDHTARIALMKADGSFVGTIVWNENSDTAEQKLKNLLKG